MGAAGLPFARPETFREYAPRNLIREEWLTCGDKNLVGSVKSAHHTAVFPVASAWAVRCTSGI
jgi:hypothetical protein